MNRRIISFFLMVAPLLLLAVVGFDAAQAASNGQAIAPDPQERVEALPQPVRFEIQQRVPLTISLAPAASPTTTLTVTQPIVFQVELLLSFTVTQTLSTTVPSTVTLRLAEPFTPTAPISLTGPITPAVPITPTRPYTVESAESIPALVVAVVLPAPPLPAETVAPTVTQPVTVSQALTPTTPLTVTQPITPSAAVTPEITPVITATIAPTVTLAPTVTATPVITDAVTPIPTPITATSAVTANLRGGPGLDFPVVGSAGIGQPLEIVAISADGGWYLLSGAQWIAAFLVTNPPADAPVATPELIQAITEAAATAAEPEATPEPEAPPEPEVTPEPVAPTVTVNANLRGGPSTDFPIIGGTVVGQEITILGQNADGGWYLLDNGGWVAANLVANAPADLPVVPDDATPESLNPAPTPAPLLLPTPTPAAAAAPAAAPAITLGLAETVYVDEIRGLLARYTLSSDTVRRLIGEATADNGLLADATWSGEMTTAIDVLRTTGEQIREMDEPSALFAAAQIDFRAASNAFDQAATLLDEGVIAADLAKFEQAIAEIEFGSTLSDRGLGKIDILLP